MRKFPRPPSQLLRRPRTPAWRHLVTTLVGCGLVGGGFAGCSPQSTQAPPQMLVSALEARPDEPAPYYYLARAHAANGRVEDAVTLLDVLASRGFSGGILTSDFADIEHDHRYRTAAARLEAFVTPRVLSFQVRIIDRPDLRPEGIALDPRTRTFFIGDLLGGDILALPPDQEARTLVSGDGRSAVYGLELDSARDVLWAAVNETGSETNRSWLIGYRLDASHEPIEIEMPAGEINDLCRRGDEIFATDSEHGRVYRVDIEMRTSTTLSLEADLRAANGIACNEASDDIFIAAWLDIYRLDAQTGSIRALATPDAVSAGGFDGLYRRGESLVGIQNAFGVGRVVAMALAPDRDTITVFEVLEIDVPDQRIPTTGAIDGDSLVYITNSQLDRPVHEPSDPIALRRLPLP